MRTFNIVASLMALTVLLPCFIPAFAEVVYARISSIIMRDETVYEPGCTVPISVRIAALGSRGDSYFIVISVKHEKTNTWDHFLPQEYYVHKSTEFSGGLVNYQIPDNASAGYYDMGISVSNGHKMDDGTVILGQILAEREIPAAFEVVHEPKNGCIKLDDPIDSPYLEKTVFHYYESRSDGFYRDGVKINR